MSVTEHHVEAEAKQATSSPKHHSVIPAPRIAEWWFARQVEKIGLMSKGDIDLLMVGDSITNNFKNEKVGLKVWEKYFVPLKAINLGFGGDALESLQVSPFQISKSGFNFFNLGVEFDNGIHILMRVVDRDHSQSFGVWIWQFQCKRFGCLRLTTF